MVPAWSRVVVLVACSLVCATSFAELLKPREVDKIPAAPPDQTIAYGSDSQQFGICACPRATRRFPLPSSSTAVAG